MKLFLQMVVYTAQYLIVCALLAWLYVSTLPISWSLSILISTILGMIFIPIYIDVAKAVTKNIK